MASHRILEVNLISGKDLKDVNFITKLEVYAVAMLSGQPNTRQRTPTDRENRRNPNWNFPLKFHIPTSSDVNLLKLDIYLRAEKALGDRDVGEVHVSIKDLDTTPRGDGKGLTFVSYQVRRPSGRPYGSINFSYRLGDPVSAQNPSPPATVYPPSQYGGNPISAQNPPPHPSTATVYPPPQSSKVDEPVTAYPVGYSTPQKANAYPPPAGYPPQGYAGYSGPGNYGGYGYPPQQTGAPSGYGYGSYVAPAPPPPKKNKFGMGLGAGLLGGALGGLLIGDMIGDAGSYDAGYDAGFDDGGGFDF